MGREKNSAFEKEGKKIKDEKGRKKKKREGKEKRREKRKKKKEKKRGKRKKKRGNVKENFFYLYEIFSIPPPLFLTLKMGNKHLDSSPFFQRKVFFPLFLALKWGIKI